MITQLFERIAGSNEFARAAMKRGVPRTLARLLGNAAGELCPEQPMKVLDSRELLERVALHVAVGDCGNLELSYARINQLAECFELLELTRTTDIPDPFRRVWISNGSGRSFGGVALTCENEELAVFCPPDGKPVAEEGRLLTISYLGFDDTVNFQLRLVDSCLFPGGLMLHLARAEGTGAIGRRQQRFEVDLPASIRPHNADRERSCLVLDVSLGGLRVDCDMPLSPGQCVSLKLWLADGEIEAFVSEVEVRWARPVSGGRSTHGLRFIDLDSRQERRLATFLAQLRSAGPSLLG